MRHARPSLTSEPVSDKPDLTGKDAEAGRTRMQHARAKLVPTKVTRSQLAARESFVERLLLAGATHANIYKLAARPTTADPPGLGIGKTAAVGAIRRVMDRWVAESEADRSFNKVTAVRRLFSHMQDARRDKKWSAVLGCERLIADIQGTREPIRIDLNANVNMALVNCIGAMTSEDREALLAEYEVLEETAAQLKQG